MLTRVWKMSLMSQSRLSSTQKVLGRRRNQIVESSEVDFVTFLCQKYGNRKITFFWQKFSDNFHKMSELLQFFIKVSNISQIFWISHVSQYCGAAVWINSTWGIQSNSNYSKPSTLFCYVNIDASNCNTREKHTSEGTIVPCPMDGNFWSWRQTHRSKSFIWWSSVT